MLLLDALGMAAVFMPDLHYKSFCHDLVLAVVICHSASMNYVRGSPRLRNTFETNPLKQVFSHIALEINEHATRNEKPVTCRWFNVKLITSQYSIMIDTHDG
jgi:hypothetical protein